jgi:GNAT superfamily N-acetyltransferase
LSRLAYDSKASWGYDEAFMEACRAELTISAADLEEHHAFVVARGDVLLGFYMLKMEGACAEVWDFFMAGEAMGSGLGGRLWRHLETTARRCGAASIGVDSDPNAEGFYRKMGLRRCGEAPSLSVPGRMLPRLERTL